MWTWLPRFVAMVATEWIVYAKMKNIGLEQNAAVNIVSEIINLLFIVYFVKVRGIVLGCDLTTTVDAFCLSPPPLRFFLEQQGFAQQQQ